MKKAMTTLCVIEKDGKILLALKKRGFGKGKWNGFGGKVQEDESLLEAAIRECQEEGGITPTDLTACGKLTFFFEQSSHAEMHVHLFYGHLFTGELQETEEMKPAWFFLKDIPYEKMWADDAYWLSYVLEGKHVEGTFWFDDESTIIHHTLKVT